MTSRDARISSRGAPMYLTTRSLDTMASQHLLASRSIRREADLADGCAPDFFLIRFATSG